MSTMTNRFIISRWSPTRKSIHDLKVGGNAHFEPDEYYNVKSSVERLNDAYGGEKVWQMTGRKCGILVNRIK